MHRWDHGSSKHWRQRTLGTLQSEKICLVALRDRWDTVVWGRVEKSIERAVMYILQTTAKLGSHQPHNDKSCSPIPIQESSQCPLLPFPLDFGLFGTQLTCRYFFKHCCQLISKCWRGRWQYMVLSYHTLSFLWYWTDKSTLIISRQSRFCPRQP